MTKNVLITGATGFIGRHCLPLLLERGYEVHAVTSRSPVDDFPHIQWQQCELLDSRKVSALVERLKPTHLLHLAWFTVPGNYWTSLENLRWVRASLDLLKAFAKNGGRRAVVAGTCAEYDWQYGYCSEHITPVNPSTLYGICKHSLHIMGEAFAQQKGIQTAWGRVFFLYGPYEHPNRLISSVICALLKAEPARCSHGKQIRDFLYVKDAAEAFVALLESKISGAVNIASGYPIAIKEVINKIADKLDRRDLVKMGVLPVAANEPHLLVADVTRLQKEVGWLPKYDLNRGLEQTIDWWNNHLIGEDSESAL